MAPLLVTVELAPVVMSPAMLPVLTISVLSPVDVDPPSVPLLVIVELSPTVTVPSMVSLLSMSAPVPKLTRPPTLPPLSSSESSPARMSPVMVPSLMISALSSTSIDMSDASKTVPVLSTVTSFPNAISLIPESAGLVMLTPSAPLAIEKNGLGGSVSQTMTLLAAGLVADPPLVLTQFASARSDAAT